MPHTLRINSTAFDDGKAIPLPHACPDQGGEDLSPPLNFSGVPQGTKSLALIMDDPDAPTGTWTHWLWWDMNATTAGLEAGADVSEQGAFRGTNSWDDDNLRYRGPCPPEGTGEHRYVFRLYALDILIGLPEGATRSQMDGAMDGHVIQSATWIGTFEHP